jgi:hypothetical protein
LEISIKLSRKKLAYLKYPSKNKFVVIPPISQQRALLRPLFFVDINLEMRDPTQKLKQIEPIRRIVNLGIQYP